MRFDSQLLGADTRYGLELVSTSNGRLKRGTIYVTLGRMEDKGFVTSQLEDRPPPHGGLRRRLYTRTSVGRRVLSAYSRYLSHLETEFQP